MSDPQDWVDIGGASSASDWVDLPSSHDSGSTIENILGSGIRSLAQNAGGLVDLASAPINYLGGEDWANSFHLPFGGSMAEDMKKASDQLGIPEVQNRTGKAAVEWAAPMLGFGGAASKAKALGNLALGALGGTVADTTGSNLAGLATIMAPGAATSLFRGGMNAIGLPQTRAAVEAGAADSMSKAGLDFSGPGDTLGAITQSPEVNIAEKAFTAKHPEIAGPILAENNKALVNQFEDATSIPGASPIADVAGQKESDVLAAIGTKDKASLGEEMKNLLEQGAAQSRKENIGDILGQIDKAPPINLTPTVERLQSYIKDATDKAGSATPFSTREGLSVAQNFVDHLSRSVQKPISLEMADEMLAGLRSDAAGMKDTGLKKFIDHVGALEGKGPLYPSGTEPFAAALAQKRNYFAQEYFPKYGSKETKGILGKGAYGVPLKDASQVPDIVLSSQSATKDFLANAGDRAAAERVLSQELLRRSMGENGAISPQKWNNVKTEMVKKGIWKEIPDSVKSQIEDLATVKQASDNLGSILKLPAKDIEAKLSRLSPEERVAIADATSKHLAEKVLGSSVSDFQRDQAGPALYKFFQEPGTKEKLALLLGDEKKAEALYGIGQNLFAKSKAAELAKLPTGNNSITGQLLLGKGAAGALFGKPKGKIAAAFSRMSPYERTGVIVGSGLFGVLKAPIVGPSLVAGLGLRALAKGNTARIAEEVTKDLLFKKGFAQNLVKNPTKYSELPAFAKSAGTAIARTAGNTQPTPTGASRKISLPSLVSEAQAEELPKKKVSLAIHPKLAAAMIKQESGGKSDAVSSAGAQGMMQLMPKTGKAMADKLGVAYRPFDPAQNVMLGTQYMKEQIDRFKDLKLALAAYNAGPAKISSLIKTHGPSWSAIKPYLVDKQGRKLETQAYVENIYRNFNRSV